MDELSVKLIKALRQNVKTFRPLGNSTSWSNDDWYTFRILEALNELVEEFDPDGEIQA
jgi:hypothetical protein